MNVLLKLEYLGVLILAFILNIEFGFAWWLFLLFLLVPDFSMLGYMINSQAGATIYNLFHHQGLAIIIGFSGYYFSIEWMLFAGLIMLAHSALDRIFGFGLKYGDGFKHTHLSPIDQK